MTRLRGIPRLTQLQEEKRQLDFQAAQNNLERRKVFKSWFGRNLTARFVTHTKGMTFPPGLVSWLRTKKLDDTYRGSLIDTSTSTKPDHGYRDEVRLTWSAQVFAQALSIILDGPEYAELRLSGKPIRAREVTDLVKALIDETLDELVRKNDPFSATTLVCNIVLPKDMLANAGIDDLKQAAVTLVFVEVNR